MARAALTQQSPSTTTNPQVVRTVPGAAGSSVRRAGTRKLAGRGPGARSSGWGRRRHAAGGAPDQGIERRLQLFAYLQPGRNHRTYLAIMRLFTSTLLADLSAGEVASALAKAEREGQIDPGESQIEVVLPRLRQLLDWGNLVLGRREAVATSIAEFQQGSVRYQVSKLAVRVQRDADELLRVPEGAREVSRELLPAIERGVDAARAVAGAGAVATEQSDPGSRGARRAREMLAEQVTTLFLQHAELAVTVRDFYAYLGQVLTRNHLAAEEITGFRDLLVEYIQLVVEDVLRHTPRSRRGWPAGRRPASRAAASVLVRAARPGEARAASSGRAAGPRRLGGADRLVRGPAGQPEPGHRAA